MEITLEDTRYLVAVAEAYAQGRLPKDAIKDTCPECYEVLDAFRTGDHLMISDGGPRAEIVLAIGCEGNWVIDPTLVGIDCPDWMPDTELAVLNEEHANPPNQVKPTWGPWGSDGRPGN